MSSRPNYYFLAYSAAYTMALTAIFLIDISFPHFVPLDYEVALTVDKVAARTAHDDLLRRSLFFLICLSRQALRTGLLFSREEVAAHDS